jgi:hypothetical protein
VPTRRILRRRRILLIDPISYFNRFAEALALPQIIFYGLKELTKSSTEEVKTKIDQVREASRLCIECIAVLT